jgi:dGTPase
MEIMMLKELTWHYVIKNPSLACQQHGQRLIIRTLFETYSDAWKSGARRWALFPQSTHEVLKKLAEKYGSEIPDEQGFRVVADTIAWMTDHQALQMYTRLAGVLPGSVLDPILR